MDLKAKIEEIIAKVKSDKDFSAEFAKEPVKAVEKVLGVSLPKDQLNSLVDGVKAKLAADDAGGLLGKVKKLF